MRTQKRGYQVAALAVAGLLLASGCGGGDDDNASDTPGGNTDGAASRSIAVRGCKPQNPLIPTNTNETCGGNILDAVTAKLIRYNPDDGSPENDIAESIESPDA